MRGGDLLSTQHVMFKNQSLPQPIIKKLKELERIIEENPSYIPLPVVASFLGANAEGLRACIEAGNCPFGICWRKNVRGNKAFKIPTLTFFMWYTRGCVGNNSV